jgi:ABC-2 type transport system permease protein
VALEAVRRNLQRFAQAFNTETRLAVRSWTIHWLGWLWPLLLFTLISGVYQAGTLLDMPVAVVDADHSSSSRRVVRELMPHARSRSLACRRACNARRAADYALPYIPRDFEAGRPAGRQPKAELYYNSLFYSAGYYSTQDFGGLVSALNPGPASTPGRRHGPAPAEPGEHQRPTKACSTPAATTSTTSSSPPSCTCCNSS